MARTTITSESVTTEEGGILAVDPNSAENLLASAHLGERIKRLRLKRSMGLVELGRKTGLSASFLSQLETGRVVPTLRNLARVALVFGKDLSHFFDSADPNSQRIFRIQRKKDRVRLPHGSSRADYISESFGILVPEGGLRPCKAEFFPGDEFQPFHPHIYPGVEMVYVLDGTLEVNRRGEPHVLESRDVLYISGETQRTYKATGDKPAQALIISFDAETGDLRRNRRKLVPTEAA
ncbi:helix-turn-helix domain-containing protein [Granulicella paludicola]|uniref:helix-turn-helix domain-containing protein n=1 Tax=Granulicella paludicola TaxID=474951 RepID=UPI0021DF7880|nr:XRE family transcriptional regulator [Granulicella paludicola]